MADNTVLNTGTGGDTVASDDIGGIKHQRVKLSVGADGAANDAIPVSNGLDTTAAGVPAVGVVGQFDDTSTGTVTENQFAPVRISSRRALLVEGVASGTVIPVSDGGGNLSIDDGGNTITVDGTVAVSGTVAATDNGGSLTVDNATLSVVGGGVEATALRVTLATDSTGVVSVDDNGATLSVDDGAGSLTIDNAALSVTGGGVEASALRVTLASDSTGVLSVDDNGATLSIDDGAGSLTVDGTVAATQSGTWTVQPGNTANTTAWLVDARGNVAHDAADSGNPLKIGGRADPTFQAAAADGDRVDAIFDVYGALFTRTDHPNRWSYHSNGSTALTDASVQAAPGAGLSVYVTDIVFSLGAATASNLIMEEGASTILGPYYLEAVAGRSIHVRFRTPKKATANTAVTVTTSAAVAHAVDILGFIAP